VRRSRSRPAWTVRRRGRVELRVVVIRYDGQSSCRIGPRSRGSSASSSKTDALLDARMSEEREEALESFDANRWRESRGAFRLVFRGATLMMNRDFNGCPASVYDVIVIGSVPGPQAAIYAPDPRCGPRNRRATLAAAHDHTDFENYPDSDGVQARAHGALRKQAERSRRIS